METLDISTIFEKACDSFPIASSIFFDQHFEFLVFFVGPPSLFAFVEKWLSGHVLDAIHDFIDNVFGTAVVFFVGIQTGKTVFVFLVEVLSGLFEYFVVEGF